MASDRSAALKFAVTLHENVFVLTAAGTSRDEAVTGVLQTADRFYQWLVKPVHLKITVGEIVNQETGKPSEEQHSGGSTVQLHDDEKVNLTVEAQDAKGADVLGETLVWSILDESVATLQVADDSMSCEVVAGTPGSTTGTVSDDAAGVSATFAVDVVPGGVALISITEGTPEKQ